MVDLGHPPEYDSTELNDTLNRYFPISDNR
jgi:hypothetical protein